MDTFYFLGIVTLALLALKYIIGFHFPWEKCQCCGKPWREHNYKPTKEDRTRKWLEDKLDDHRVNIQYPKPDKQYSKWLRIGKYDVTYDSTKLRYEVFTHMYIREDTIRTWVYTDITSIGTAGYLWRKTYGKAKHTPAS